MVSLFLLLTNLDPKPIGRPSYGRGQRNPPPDSNLRKRPYSPNNRSRSNSGGRFRNRSGSPPGRSPGGYRPPMDRGDRGDRGYGRG